MSEERAGSARPVRADASRNIEAIMRAAIDVLSARPEASVEEIAQEAGVARQTVYAHFSSREALIEAVLERGLAMALAAFDSVRLEEWEPDDALDRLLDATWEVANSFRLFDLPAIQATSEEEDEGHAPIMARLEPLLKRGQEAGIFDPDLSVGWMIAAFIGLAHTAGAEVRAGRLDPAQGLHVLKLSVRRVLGTGG